jgi:hypothetical protein
MKSQILNIILFAFIISLFMSFLISWTNYNSTQGNEAKQGMFIFLMINTFLCFINIILSLPGLLNLNEKIRRNKILSYLTFTILPLTLYILLVVMFFKTQSLKEDFMDFVGMSAPSIIFCIAVTLQFYKYRKKIEANKT